jgi:hypothetical protein
MLNHHKTFQFLIILFLLAADSATHGQTSSPGRKC